MRKCLITISLITLLIVSIYGSLGLSSEDKSNFLYKILRKKSPCIRIISASIYKSVCTDCYPKDTMIFEILIKNDGLSDAENLKITVYDKNGAILNIKMSDNLIIKSGRLFSLQKIIYFNEFDLDKGKIFLNYSWKKNKYYINEKMELEFKTSIT
jgi:hypothetical protein